VEQGRHGHAVALECLLPSGHRFVSVACAVGCRFACHIGIVSLAAIHGAAIHPLATYPIAEGRGPNPFGRFRHVTALSQPQLTHSPASAGDERPTSTVHLALPIVNNRYYPSILDQYADSTRP
jgi:hypothetical protein